MVFKGSVSQCKHARLRFQKYGEENSFFSNFFHVDVKNVNKNITEKARISCIYIFV